MDKIKEFLKKKILWIAIGLVLLIVVIVLIFALTGNKNQSKELSASLKSLGVEFYENFYYNQIGETDKERKTFLGKYSDIGIKISLENLARSKKEESENILKQFVNKKTKEECDTSSSMVIIYPKDPYGKTDYTIDAILVCGFEENTTK